MANANFEIAIGIPRDADNRLMGILDNCIQYVSVKDTSEAINMELTNRRSEFSLSAFLREYSTEISVVVIIILLVITILIIVMRRILRRIIAYDKLTGCHNKLHFEKIVPKILIEQENTEYYIVAFDLYRFKYFIQ